MGLLPVTCSMWYIYNIRIEHIYIYTCTMYTKPLANTFHWPIHLRKLTRTVQKNVICSRKLVLQSSCWGSMLIFRGKSWTERGKKNCPSWMPSCPSGWCIHISYITCCLIQISWLPHIFSVRPLGLMDKSNENGHFTCLSSIMARD